MYQGQYICNEGVLKSEEVLDILRELIQANSENPVEAPCGRKLLEICRKEGLNVEIVPVASGINDAPEAVIASEGSAVSDEKLRENALTADGQRFNVMITLGADSYRDGQHGLLIHGHYDTVPVMEMKDPFSTEILDGRMWGRGTSDQKSGLAAALCAMIAAKRMGWQLKRSLCIAAVVDEESQHQGSYVLAQSGIKADYAIATEPTGGNKIEFGCRGTTPIRLRVEGKTAHASTPEKGINAIEKAMPILERLFKIRGLEADLGEFGTLRGTLCVSMMEAGSAYNNVPGEAVIWMDRRTVPGETSETVLAEVRHAIEEATKDDPSLVAEAHIARPDWKWQPIMDRGLNPTFTDPDCPLYQVLHHAALKSGYAESEIQRGIFDGYNDMDFLVNDLGIPTLVYGPGDLSLAHGPEESVDINEYLQATEVFLHTIEAICMEEEL